MTKHRLIRCFVSHPWAGHIHHFALRLTTALRGREFFVWIDEEQMLPGQTIEVRQRNGIICETDIFVFILSPETLRSANCMEELRIAINYEKPIICAKLEQCEVPAELRKSLHVDFSSPAFFEASVNMLIEGADKLYERQEIIKLLSDDDPETRSEAARILGDLHDPSSLRLIIKRVSLERDESVIYWLVVSLGTLLEQNTEDGLRVIQLLNHLEQIGSPIVKQGVLDARNKISERSAHIT